MGKAGLALVTLLDAARIGISVYSIHVKNMLESSTDYKASCDFSDYVTCSKSFGSSYGKGLGLIGPYLGEDHILNQPNGVYGIISFALHLLIALFVSSRLGLHLRLINSLIGIASSVWLGYVLLFVLHYVCPICFAIYGLNAIILVADILALRRGAAASQGKQRAAVKPDRKKKK